MQGNFLSLCTILIFLFMITKELHALKRRYIARARERGAICNDNSEAIYYIEKSSSPKNWILYLESGGACSNIAACNWRYTNFPHLMSSLPFPEEIEGLDLMSPLPLANPVFASFNKVIVPYCSSDLWLGSTTNKGHGVNGSFHFRNDSTKNDFSFQGQTIFRSVVADIMQQGLANATNVLLAGSSAGGIGVVNHLGWFRQELPSVTMKALIDSSWLVNFDYGLSKMMDPIFSNLTRMDDIPACKDQFFGYPCCSSVECMLVRGYLKSDAPLLFLFSFYDSFLLKFDTEVTTTAQSLKIIDLLRKLSGLRAQLEKSLDVVRNKENISYIVPACFQHHFIATSSLWKKGRLLHKEFKRSERMLHYRHVIEPGLWSSTVIKSKTVQTHLTEWYTSQRTLHLEDTCQGSQCNPTCTSGVTYGDSLSYLPFIYQIILTVVCVSIILILTCVKLYFKWKYVQMVWKQRKYLRQVGEVVDVTVSCDLPVEAPKDAIGVSCLNLSFEVPRQKDVFNQYCNSADTIEDIVSNKMGAVQMKTEEQKCNVRLYERKKILKGVTAYFNPGQLVGIMGPSGSGKTTFLDLLAGRRRPGFQQGTIFINGMPACHLRDWAKRRTGYVLQLAVPFYEQLTVRENLTFSALLRLPSSDSLRLNFEKIEEVISQTGLEKRADVKVGRPSGGGLSGGEKRRLCVANQLLDSPSLLLMDEPTSGLDAASSLELLQLLHRLAVSGKLVILTIHQPRAEIFHMFDTVLFLCRGQIAYFGSPLMSPRLLLEAIQSVDMDDKVMNKRNPADTILDFLNKPDLQNTILDYYQSTGEIQSIKNAITVATKEATLPTLSGAEEEQASFINRMFAWECRAAASQTRLQRAFLPLVFIVCGTALSTVYWKTDMGITLLAAVIVFTCFSQLFMASVIYALMLNCRRIFYLESQDGIGTPLELILQAFIRVTSISLLPVSGCAVLVYFSIVVTYNVLDVLKVVMISVLLNQTWSAILILVNVCTVHYSPMLTQFLAAVAGFSGGFLVPKPEMPFYYYWIFYINPTQWAFASISKIIVMSAEFPCQYESPLECQSQKGTVVLDQFEILEIDPFHGIMVLLIMMITAIILAIVIMTLKVSKRERTMTAKQILRKITGRTNESFQYMSKQNFTKETTILQNYNSPEHMLQSMRNGSTLQPGLQQDGCGDHNIVDDVFYTDRELQAKYLDRETVRHAVYVTAVFQNRSRHRRGSGSDSCSCRWRKISKASPGRISVNDASSEILKERSISFQAEAQDVIQSFGKVVEEAMRVKRTGRKWKEKVGKRRMSQSTDGSGQSSHLASVHGVILEMQDEESQESDGTEVDEN